MQWIVQSFPACRHHVFLSHCREDRAWLVQPLYEALQRAAVIPWLDRHHYPYGRHPFSALRDSVLQCQHTVFLVTEAMVTQARGWATLELAWAHLLQESLYYPGGVLQNVMLPLYFLENNNKVLPPSVWQSVRDRGRFHVPADGAPVDWAARQIRSFLEREWQFGADQAVAIAQDKRFRASLKKRPGLIDRITARSPGPIPKA